VTASRLLLDTHVFLWWRGEPSHRDPFDRMLVAQAQLEDLTLVTHDRLLKSYEVKILWA
jgi:PIN domain nuclease of toxin-antitoxin system